MTYQLRPEEPFRFCAWNRWWAFKNIPHTFHIDICMFPCPFSAGIHFFMIILWVEAALSLPSLMDHWYFFIFSSCLAVLFLFPWSLRKGLSFGSASLLSPAAALLCRYPPCQLPLCTSQWSDKRTSRKLCCLAIPVTVKLIYGYLELQISITQSKKSALEREPSFNGTLCQTALHQ